MSLINLYIILIRVDFEYKLIIKNKINILTNNRPGIF